MTGYFQIEFTSSAFSDDENEIHTHYQNSTAALADQGNSKSTIARTISITPNSSKADERIKAKSTSPRTPVPYKSFLGFYCLFILVTGCAGRAYFHGILRLVQQTGLVNNVEIRVMALAYDVGVIFGLLPICFTNTAIHRPKVLGIGAAFVGVGFLFACLPYFIMKTQLPRTSLAPEKDDYELCLAPNGDLNEVVTQYTDNSTRLSATPSLASEDSRTMVWLIIGMLLSGFGSAPQFVVGIPYIDDIVKGPFISPCIALVLGVHFGGVWMGQLASFFMWHHISVADPEVLTRWWLGFFVAAMGALVSGLIMFMFRDPDKVQPAVTMEKNPRRIANEGESPYYERLTEDSGEADSDVSPAPSRTSRLAKNMAFISLNLGGALEAAVMTALLVFQPRYIGSVTGIGIAPAQLFTGSSIVVGVIVGLGTGACLIYFRKWSPKTLSTTAFLACVSALCFAWALFFFHCGDPDIAGGIQNSPTGTNPSSKIYELLYQANVTASCSFDCSCTSATFTPVCGENQLTYLSPCSAGCKNVLEIDKPDVDGHKTLNFTDCTCVNATKRHGSSRLGYALSGACAVTCSPAWLYWVVLCAMFTFAGIQYTHQMLLVIRCVVPKDRTAALCILVITWHLLGYVPALIYFSYVLNTSCILWSNVVHPTYHDCLIYDSSSHHLYICTLVVFLKSLSVLCSGITYRSTKDTQDRYNRDWVYYDILEMDSVSERDGNESRQPAYI